MRIILNIRMDIIGDFIENKNKEEGAVKKNRPPIVRFLIQLLGVGANTSSFLWTEKSASVLKRQVKNHSTKALYIVGLLFPEHKIRLSLFLPWMMLLPRVNKKLPVLY